VPAGWAFGGFRVKDVNTAYDHLLAQGGEPVKMNTGPMELHIPGIRGIGNSIIYLIDRYDSGAGELSIYDIDFEYLDGVDRNPEGCGFKLIDHLTHNVYGGRMKYWADFYEQLFNFQEIRYFDIKGEYTGLTSKALTAPETKKAKAAAVKSKNFCANLTVRAFSTSRLSVMTWLNAGIS